MSVNSRRKGVRRERDVAKLYRAAGFEADRNDAILESTATQHRTTQRTGRDVRVGLRRDSDGNLADVLPLCVQVKDQRCPNVPEAYAEAVSAAGASELPVLHVSWSSGPGTPALRLVALDERAWTRLLGLVLDAGMDPALLLEDAAGG